MVEVKNLQNNIEFNTYSKSNDCSTVDNKSYNTGIDAGKGKYSKEDLQKSVDKLNDFMENDETYAEISFHEDFKHDIMVKIIDKKTKEVIMEIPPKKIIDMVAEMCKIAGVIFDKKA